PLLRGRPVPPRVPIEAAAPPPDLPRLRGRGQGARRPARPAGARGSAGVTTADEAPLPGGDFRLLVQKMGYQALIGLGVVENPLTGERSRNPAGARAVLADLAMLREK